MIITLINASPKRKDSSSGKLLGLLKSNFTNNVDVSEICFLDKNVSAEQKLLLNRSDVIVFAAPLYVDGLPGHLLSCLQQIEQEKAVNHNACVYGIINCGFYEGIHTRIALKILRNWCDKVGIQWCGGLGIGGGGAMAYMPIEKFQDGNFGKELCLLSKRIIKKEPFSDNYAQPNLSRELYIFLLERGWRNAVKFYGIQESDLDIKYKI